MKLHTIEVEIHKPIKDGYRVKVSVLDLGVYINGALVFPPNDKHTDWIVYAPSIATRFRRIYPVEFAKKKPLWREIHTSCEDAVKLHIADEDRYEDIDGLSSHGPNKYFDNTVDVT